VAGGVRCSGKEKRGRSSREGEVEMEGGFSAAAAAGECRGAGVLTQPVTTVARIAIA